MIPGIIAAQSLLQFHIPSVLLCHFDGANGATSTVDSSPAPHALTIHSNAALSTAAPEFGTAALSSGTTGKVSAAISSDFNLDAQFTIEASIYLLSTVAQSAGLVAYGNAGEIGDTGGTAFQLIINDGGTPIFNWSFNGSAIPNVQPDSPTVANINQWYRIAADRDANGVVRLYQDGVMILGPGGGGVSPGTIFTGVTTGLTIGGVQDGPGFYLDEVRITRNVARYASDAGYTPHVSAFPNF